MPPTDAETDDGSPRGRVSRRRLFALSGGAAVTALGLTACGRTRSGPAAHPGASTVANTSTSPGRVTAPPPSRVLAANVNEALEKLDLAELRAVSGTWIRGFYPMTNADRGDPAGQTGVQKLLQAAGQGYGTVLTTKFQYHDQPVPAPGTAAMTTALARLDTLLAATMGRVDILTIGNEPFIETREADRTTPAINVFYEALAQHAIQYRRDHGGTKTKIYMGALTGMDRPGAQTAQTKRWMTFTAGTPALAGTDIHPHVPSMAAAQKYLDYVLPFLRRDQTFLVTEFSLVQLWRQHNTDPVNPAFAAKYKVARDTPVWRFIHDAANHHVSEQEWNDFVLSNTWFAANKTFLTDQVARFRATGKLAVAGYGLYQSAPIPRYDAKSAPWVLNCLFPQYVCQPGTAGLPGRNRTWCDEFRAAQQR